MILIHDDAFDEILIDTPFLHTDTAHYKRATERALKMLEDINFFKKCATQFGYEVDVSLNLKKYHTNFYGKKGDKNYLVCDTVNIYLVIKFENINVTNELGHTDLIKDAYFAIRFTFSQTNNKLDAYTKPFVWRENVPYHHIHKGYIHSHISTVDYFDTYSIMHQDICFGSESSIASALNFKAEGYEFIDYDVEAVSDTLHIMNMFLKTESLEGVPYKHLLSNFNTKSRLKHDGDCDSDFVKFVSNLVLENIEDERIQINSSGHDVSVNITLGNSKYLTDLISEDPKYKSYLLIQDEVGEFSHRQIENLDKINSFYTEEFLTLSFQLSPAPFLWKGKKIYIKPYKSDVTLPEHCFSLGLSRYQLRNIQAFINSQLNKKLKLNEIYR